MVIHSQHPNPNQKANLVNLLPWVLWREHEHTVISCEYIFLCKCSQVIFEEPSFPHHQNDPLCKLHTRTAKIRETGGGTSQDSLFFLLSPVLCLPTCPLCAASGAVKQALYQLKPLSCWSFLWAYWMLFWILYDMATLSYPWNWRLLLKTK